MATKTEVLVGAGTKQSFPKLQLRRRIVAWFAAGQMSASAEATLGRDTGARI